MAAQTEGFYRRPLPESCIAFSSTEGRQLFREVLELGAMEGYFPYHLPLNTQRFLKSLKLMSWRLLWAKKNKIWLWTAVNKGSPGIFAWVLGDRSAQTFAKLWSLIRGWQSYFYVTDGYPVYPCFIDKGDHIVKKIYMIRVEGENTRLRHYLARLRRKTLCYSKSAEMLRASIKLLLHYLHTGTVSLLL